MAEIVFIETDDNNIIVGVHSDEPSSSSLPELHSIVEKTLEEPYGLLGLPIAQVDEEPENRDEINPISENDKYRNILKQQSIELDLMVRLGEDTTALQAEFDRDKAIYQSLP